MATRKVQHLTLEGVKAAGRKAYDKKRLTAQHPAAFLRQCTFTGEGPSPRDKQYHCVVGSALEPRTLRHIKQHPGFNTHGVGTLVDKGIVSVNLDELNDISHVQRAHDDWAQASRGYASDDRSEAMHQRFLRMIEHPSAFKLEV